MLRSLIYQLIDQYRGACERLLVIFRDKLKKHTRGHWDWGRGELEEYLSVEANQTHPKPIIFLIDALDECGEKEVQNVVTFLELLSTDAVHAGIELRICLSSRHYPTISIRKCLQLVVEEIQEHDDDIKLYLRDRLIRANRKSRSPDSRQSTWNLHVGCSGRGYAQPRVQPWEDRGDAESARRASS